MFLLYPPGNIGAEIVGLFFMVILQYVKLNNPGTASETELKAYHLSEEAEKMTEGAEDLKAKISGTLQIAMGMGQLMIAPMIAGFGIIDTIKAIDLDTISISLGVPKISTCSCYLS